MHHSRAHEFDTRLLRNHKADWEELAAFDPMWAILSRAEKRNNKWSEEEFFKTGKAEIADLMAELTPLSRARERALDFGCGIGRLTRSLLDHYSEAYGVDVSANMIEKARQLTPRCHFYVNESQDLSRFPDKTFDLIYSNRVLQHLPSSMMIGNFIREFFRVVTPGGIVVFQAPDRKSHRNFLNLKRSTYYILKSLGFQSEVIFRKFKLHPMRMTAIPQHMVHSIIAESGGELIRQRRDASAHFAVLYFCRRLLQ